MQLDPSALNPSWCIMVRRGLPVCDYGIWKFKKAKKLHFEIKIRSRWTVWFYWKPALKYKPGL